MGNPIHLLAVLQLKESWEAHSLNQCKARVPPALPHFPSSPSAVREKLAAAEERAVHPHEFLGVNPGGSCLA